MLQKYKIIMKVLGMLNDDNNFYLPKGKKKQKQKQESQKPVPKRTCHSNKGDAQRV